MVTVEIPVERSALVKTFAGMRSWLDHRHYEIGLVREIAVSKGLLVKMAFADATIASDFAAEFGGKSASGDVSGHVLK